jgi:hypothetical protein
MVGCELAGVHLNDYDHEVSGKRLVCRDGTIKHVNCVREDRLVTTIPLEEVQAVSTDTDRSETGFTKLAVVYLAVALGFSYVSHRFLRRGASLDIVTGGTYATALLCWFAVYTFASQEVGRFSILTIETAEETFIFVSEFEEEKFEAVRSHVQQSVA